MPGSMLHLCVDILIGTKHIGIKHIIDYNFFVSCHPLDCNLVALVGTYIAYGGTSGFLHVV